MAGNGIDRDTQNLGVEGFEFIQVILVARYLFASDRGPVERIKGQHDVFLSPILGQGDRSPHMRGQSKVRRLISNFNHGISSAIYLFDPSHFFKSFLRSPAQRADFRWFIAIVYISTTA